MKTFVRAVVVGLLVYALPQAAGAATVPQEAGKISAADAAPFLGEWTLALQGANGPATFTVWVTAEKDVVAAEIASDALPKQAIASISLVNKSLVLAYSFNWQGNPVSAVASITPDKDGKTAAQMDFAGGAYVMTGTATRKDKDKDK